MSWQRKEQLSEDVTLYLGDCREVLPTLGGSDVLVTDPPYGMSFRSNYRRIQHGAIAYDKEVWPLEFACRYPAQHSAYIFARWDDIARVPKPRSLVTWIKNNWSMGDLAHEHARQSEVVLFYPGPDHHFPNGRPSDVIAAARTGNHFHPTEKPVQLMSAIIQWTAGAVCDPFMGSGTTGVACVQLGRKFIGIELEPKYYDIACRRIADELRRPRLALDAPPVMTQQGLDL